MRKMALGIILAGCVFITFALYFAGIDLLIDAVGFLLILNGAHTLTKYGDRFGPCVPLCLGLVVVAALHLFFGGAAGLVIGLARACGESALFLLLAHGLALLPTVRPRPVPRIAARVAAAGGAVFVPATALFSAFCPGAAADVLGIILLCWRVLFMAVLLWILATANDRRGPAAGVENAGSDAA
jgi:hypothetical protein